MEKEFSKNVLKPGDKGFEYDKRVDYSSHNQDADSDENSWDEGKDNDYFDDDFAWTDTINSLFERNLII